MKDGKITFLADSVFVGGPYKSDNFKINFETGEYQAVNIAPLMVAPEDKIIKVTVEFVDDTV